MNNNEINECPAPNGILLIIGGAENKGEATPGNKKRPADFQRLEILECFVELTGKKDPVVKLFTTATSEGGESFKEYKQAFEELGVTNIEHIHHNTRKEVLDDEGLNETVRKADAFFFAGGDQLKYTALYGGTAFLNQLMVRYINEKIVIAGTSAGAMAMSTPMIYGGNGEVQELGGNIKVTTGLEFLKDVCVDTHFVHRGRLLRMAQVILTNPTCIGMGIEEDTAIIIRNGVDVEVVGTGTVIILEGFDITKAGVEDFEDKPVVIRDLKMHILASKECYTLVQKNPPHK